MKTKVGPTPPPTPKAKFVRKFNPNLIKYGFVNGGREAEPRAQCVKCGVTMSQKQTSRALGKASGIFQKKRKWAADAEKVCVTDWKNVL